MEHVHQFVKEMAMHIHWKVARVSLACSDSKLDIDEGFRAKELNVSRPLCGELRTK